MSGLLPYEEQLAGKLADIPLPDEDKGWEAMQKMLDKDDDDGGVVPPAAKGCRNRAAALLLIVLLAGIIILYKTTNNDNPVNVAATKKSIAAAKPATKPANTNNVNKESAVVSLPVNNTIKKDAAITRQRADTFAVQKNGGMATGKAGAKNLTEGSGVIINKAAPKNPGSKQRTNTMQSKMPAKGKAAASAPQAAGPQQNPLGNSTTLSSPAEKPQAQTLPQHTDTNAITPIETTTQHSLTKNKQPAPAKDSLAARPANNANTAGNKDDSNNDNNIWFGAGLALQQLIPVDGQKTTPYNAYGRKGSLGDYIPSAYFRIYQQKKFLQVEFKYGAPQYTKDIAYQQKIISHDSSTGVTVSNVNHVKKTYYHQLPVSIHYNVLPNLWIGAGFVWNKFQSAIVQQVQHTLVAQGPAGTPIDSVSAPGKIFQLNGDSATAFSKSYIQCMFEAQYTWKRFSFGARYAFGLQPYLTFTSPATGQTQKERNASLNIFLRYELWRSKKKGP